jgi:hypothetical protein
MAIITTNYNMIIMHIAECISHGRGEALSILREEYSDEDIIRDTYIHALVATDEASKQLRDYYDGWKGPEEEARMRISMVCKSFVSSKAKIIKRRREILRENGEAIIAATHSSDSETKLAKLVLGLPINEQEKIILCWRLDMIKQEEAMSELGLSRASLYGRWLELKTKLQGLFI